VTGAPSGRRTVERPPAGARTVPVVALPHIDTHAVDIAAGVDRVWEVVAGSMERALSGRMARTYATVMRADDRTAEGPRPLVEGSSMPGFRVVRAVPPTELVLAGRHRLAEYEMVFELDEFAVERTRLSLTTNAAFRRGAGSAYRALVIGSGGHAVATRRLLTTLRRRAER
jgi:hypothetical protein